MCSFFFKIVSMKQEADHGVRSPRRNLLVQFTCDSCGVRTQRIINRVAFDRGTVFLQVTILVLVESFIVHLVIDIVKIILM